MSKSDAGECGPEVVLDSERAVRVASDWDGVDPVDLLVELAESFGWSPFRVIEAMHEVVLRMERSCGRKISSG